MKADSKGIIKNIVAAKRIIDSETMEDLLNELVAASHKELAKQILDRTTNNGALSVSPNTILKLLRDLTSKQ